MTLHEFVIMAQDGLIGLVIILLGLVKIPKIDLNLWTILARVLGRAMNGELTEKVNKISSELEAHIQRTEVERINQIRQRIIRFSDEVMYDTGHSQEHYNDILEDINKYEQYCKTHPDFVNNKAAMAIDTIKEAYQYCIDNHDFLTYTKKQ